MDNGLENTFITFVDNTSVGRTENATKRLRYSLLLKNGPIFPRPFFPSDTIIHVAVGTNVTKKNPERISFQPPIVDCKVT